MLMDGPQPMDALGYVSCTATSKQSGQRCKRRPIPGGAVCVMHGGGTPRVREKARERLLRLQSPAIDTLAHLMDQRESCPSTALRAARYVLDRTMGKPTEMVKQEQAREVVIRWEAD